jgi:DNA polymerase I-like protein with 3'-5' exonuclease and polymerase domains
MFRSEPGRVFVGGDISQQEPKITAHISQDDHMLEVYDEGK